ncbi:MAG: pteridine reductase [Bacteroidia bacterium]|jgi:pteridine reductase
MTTTLHPEPVALITGAAQRIGRAVAQTLHARGYSVLVHYRQSAEAANTLCTELNEKRADSAAAIAADFADIDALPGFADAVLKRFGRLDALINNASDFYPTPLGTVTPEDWDRLFVSNVRAPLFLAQAFTEALRAAQGCIINMADIYAERPLVQHSVYCSAKAALVMLSKSLALELAPAIRVNSIAPGAILWPEQHSDFSAQEQRNMKDKVPLERIGSPDDIAKTVAFLVCDAPYITGQTIAVDGGRTLSQ